MSDPATAVSLPDHCTVINDGVLYVYSPDGFQALALEKGGKWEDLPMGVSVTGGKCVLAAVPGSTGGSMYIVGGTANSSMSDYLGLQRYDFAGKKWSSISPVTKDLVNRQNHAASYLSDSNTILVYAGSTTTTEPGLSSQTFVVSTTEPFNVLSYTAELPLTAPQVLPWNSSHAIMVGGGEDNKKVLTFGPDEGWADSGTSLAIGLADSSIMRCSVVTGEDGSKVLNVYDASVSPNTVQSIVIWKGPGQPVGTGYLVGNSSSSDSKSRKRKRDLSLDNWPTYNSDDAPTIKRSGYALATDGNGLAILSGGSTEQAISVFNQQKNSWVDAQQLLGSQEPLVVSAASTSSLSSPSATATSASSISPPSSSASSTNSADGAITPPSDNSHTLTVLGATLGAIFGLAALLIIVLLLLRRRKEKRRRAEAGYINEKGNDRLSFADQGTEFMHTAGGSVGHNYSKSMNNSFTSLNIIAGKGSGPKTHTRNGGSAGSDTSTSALIPTGRRGPAGHGDALEMSQMRRDKSPSSPKLVNIGAKGGRPPPATLTDPPQLSAEAIRAARGQMDRDGRPGSRGTIGSDIRPGSSGSASRGGAIVAGMGRADGGQNSRSSGWSRYFAGGDTTTNLGGYAHQPRKKSTDSSASKSLYTRASSVTSRNDYQGQSVQPLELNLGPKFDSTLADGQRLSRVATASPSFGHSRDHSVNGRDPGASGQTAQISRAASGKSTVDSAIDDFSFGTSDGTHTATTWTPTSDKGWTGKPMPGAPHHAQQNSVASSIYSRNPQSYYPAYDDRRALYGKSGVSNASTVWPVPPKSSHGEGRDSTLSVFPRTTAPGSPGLPPMPTTVNGQKQYGYGQGPAPKKKTPVTEDVSWLNLGGNAGSSY